MTAEPAQLVRIHLGEHDQRDGRPLYEVILERCRSAGMAGATVYRGIEGYGASSLIHRPHLFGRSSDAPIVVTIVDSAAKVQAFLPVLDELLDEGLIAISNVEMLRVGSGSSSASNP
jgi:PII-like signaling protein